ncbi:MAG: class I SAM-dependent methyltransferase [Flavobacteriales bacterium]
MNERDWDDTAATFEEDVFNVPANDRLGMISAFVRTHGGKHRVAADMGCGIGRTLGLLADHFRTVEAADFSSACLDVARHQNAEHNNVRYHHVDLARTSLPFERVDLVLCINAWLMHEPDRRTSMVKRTLDAVKPGGHLLLVTPALESALFATHRLVRWQREQGHSPKVAQQKARREMSDLDMGIVLIDGVYTKHYLKEELEDMLAMYGLEVLGVEKLDYPWSRVFAEPPEWMGPPLPWNWMVTARRT